MNKINIPNDKILYSFIEIESDNYGSGDWVYIIVSSVGVCKVGKSTNPHKRFGTILSSSPVSVYPLICISYNPDIIDLEKEIHDSFSSKLSHGEWYYITIKDIFDIIMHYCSLNQNIINYIVKKINDLDKMGVYILDHNVSLEKIEKLINDARRESERLKKVRYSHSWAVKKR